MGSWLAALGSLSASIVALYLARSNSRIRLDLQISSASDRSNDDRPELYFLVVVTNQSSYPVYLGGCSFNRKRSFFEGKPKPGIGWSGVIAPREAPGPNLEIAFAVDHHRLDPGERCSYKLSLLGVIQSVSMHRCLPNRVQIYTTSQQRPLSFPVDKNRIHRGIADLSSEYLDADMISFRNSDIFQIADTVWGEMRKELIARDQGKI